MSESRAVVSDCDPMDHTPWNSPGQNTGVGSLSLLWGLFPTHRSNSGLPSLKAESLPVEPQGKLEGHFASLPSHLPLCYNNAPSDIPRVNVVRFGILSNKTFG